MSLFLRHGRERSILCGALLATGALAQTFHLEFDTLTPEIIEQRLKLVDSNLSRRRATLESLYQTAGCGGDHLSEQPVRSRKNFNILCTLQGGGAGTIVVGGHYDLADHGVGAIDDWSGAVLLPSLYQSLKAKTRRHRFIFADFTAEEIGLIGSREFVARMSKEDRKNVRAMINLECLGMTPPEVWVSRADRRLLEFYARVARSMGLGVIGSNVDLVGDDDSHPFLSAGIPVLTIHSVTTENHHILHSTRDNLNAIHPQDYYAAYHLAAEYLAYLDEALD